MDKIISVIGNWNEIENFLWEKIKSKLENEWSEEDFKGFEEFKLIDMIKNKLPIELWYKIFEQLFLTKIIESYKANEYNSRKQITRIKKIKSNNIDNNDENLFKYHSGKPIIDVIGRDLFENSSVKLDIFVKNRNKRYLNDIDDHFCNEEKLKELIIDKEINIAILRSSSKEKVFGYSHITFFDLEY